MYLREIFLSVAVMLMTLASVAAFPADVPVKTLREWKGSVADESLLSDAPGFIASAEELQKLWSHWSVPGPVPQIDFKKNIVVLVTSRGSGLRLIARRDGEGNLKVNGLGTMDFRPGFRYVLGLVSRTGVKSVNGQAISSGTAVVTGTIVYRQRIALTPDALIEVSLLDVSRADAPAVVIAKQEIRPTTQVPIPFSLSYDPKRIEGNHSYAVRATITRERKL